MARKTIRVSDMSGAEIPEGKGATVRITFADARKGVRELDLTDAEAESLGGPCRPSGPEAEEAGLGQIPAAGPGALIALIGAAAGPEVRRAGGAFIRSAR